MNSATRRLLAALPIVAGIAITLASTAAAGTGTIRGLAYPRSADLQVRSYVALRSVTVGHLAAVEVDVYNRGYSDATSATLTDTLPAGSTLVQVTQTNGTCAESAGVLTCDLAPVPHGWDVSVQLILRMPSVPGPQVNTATVHGKPSDPNTGNNTSNTTVNAVPKSHDSVAGFILPRGGDLSTPGTVGPANPTGSTLKVPASTYGQAISLSEHSTTDTAKACGDGFTCFGQYVVMNGLYANGGQPARLKVRFDASSVPHSASLTRARLFNYGAIVTACKASSNGSAIPNPCVESRTLLSDGDWQIVVRSTRSLELRL